MGLILGQVVYVAFALVNVAAFVPNIPDPDPPVEFDMTSVDSFLLALEETSPQLTQLPLGIIVGDASGVRGQTELGMWNNAHVIDGSLGVASISKWVSTAVALSVISDGLLSLDALMSDFFPWWTTDPADERSLVTVEDLLRNSHGWSSTTGFDPIQAPTGEPDELTLTRWLYGCNLMDTVPTMYGTFEVPAFEGTHETCARSLYDTSYTTNFTFAYTPGDRTDYLGSEVAGQLMSAILLQATNSPADGWNQLVHDRVGSIVGNDYVFHAPNTERPDPMVGMHTSTIEYAEFVHKLYENTLLGIEHFFSADLGAAMISNFGLPKFLGGGGPFANLGFGYQTWISPAGAPVNSGLWGMHGSIVPANTYGDHPSFWYVCGRDNRADMYDLESNIYVFPDMLGAELATLFI